MSDDVILETKNLKVQFNIPSQKHIFDFSSDSLKAVDGMNLKLKRGETLGVVGESGCGKSTLARSLIGLVEVTDGEIIFEGKATQNASKKEKLELKKDIQMIFQDPLASLDPRMTIRDIIKEPLLALYPQMSKQQMNDKVKQMMSKVGLLANVINRYPHEFSGGQCQRIGIARALVANPKLLICDEPVSALDVSIQAQVTNLLKDLQKQMKLTIIFIAHDLSVVKHISDRVLVMYLGNFIELGYKKELFNKPLHPYTQALISAVPIANPKLQRAKSVPALQGDLPSAIFPPSGCVFRTRCFKATKECADKKPPIVTLADSSHGVACIHI